MAVATYNPITPPAALPEGEWGPNTTTTVIKPSSGWAALNLREVWLYHDLHLASGVISSL